MKTIDISCPSCQGTGVYVGMSERHGAAVVCYKCDGTGKTEYHYEEFTKRKVREDVTRVYKSSYGYVIAPKELEFKNYGGIDMRKEGVSYEEFLNGDTPKHIEKLGCPMMADQGACHSKDGFIDECFSCGLMYGGSITNCKHQKYKAECWERFNNES